MSNYPVKEMQARASPSTYVMSEFIGIYDLNDWLFSTETRLVSFIERVMANPAVKDVQLPPGFSAVGDELTTVIAQFIRLANYNRAVFGSYYSEIISEALKSFEVPRSVGAEWWIVDKCDTFNG